VGEGGDSDDNSDDPESEDEGEDEERHCGPENEADIERFNAILFEAQAMAIKAE